MNIDLQPVHKIEGLHAVSGVKSRLYRLNGRVEVRHHHAGDLPRKPEPRDHAILLKKASDSAYDAFTPGAGDRHTRSMPAQP